MGHESETNDNAILKLMVEFRRLWIEQEAARSRPPASSASAPPPPEPARRTDLRAVILVGCAAIASGYLLAEPLARSTGLSAHLPWVSRADTTTRPPAGAPAMSTLTPPVAAEQTGTSAPTVQEPPTPPTVQEAPTSPAVRVAPYPPPVVDIAPAAGYHVQVGAFNVLEYAQDLTRQLRSHDYSATIVDVPTGPPHRVWITGVFDRPDAERLGDRLRNDGFEAILLRQ